MNGLNDPIKRHRQRKKQAPCKETAMGLDPKVSRITLWAEGSTELLSPKEKILKAAQDRRFLTYMSRNIRLTADLSTETWQVRKDWHEIYRVLHEKNMQPRIHTLSSKAVIQNRRRDKELPR